MAKRFYFLLVAALGLIACNGNADSGLGSQDSVSTDSLVNPSYNPKVEADSAAKDMNLDSTKLKDTAP